MTKQTEAPRERGRRQFLRGLGVAAGGAVAAVPLAVSAVAEEAPETDEVQAKGRYQETEYVKRFYALNRI